MKPNRVILVAHDAILATRQDDGFFGPRALRTSLNRAYRVVETRSFVYRRLQSLAFVLIATIGFVVISVLLVFAPILARSRPSAIANVLSAGGLVAVPIMGGYSPSKFAARAMSTATPIAWRWECSADTKPTITSVAVNLERTRA